MNPKLLALETCIICITYGTDKLHPAFDSRLHQSRERNARPNSNMSAGRNRHRNATDGASHLQHLGPYQLNSCVHFATEAGGYVTWKPRRASACSSSLHNRDRETTPASAAEEAEEQKIAASRCTASCSRSSPMAGREVINGGGEVRVRFPVRSFVCEPEGCSWRDTRAVSHAEPLAYLVRLCHHFRKRGGVIHESKTADLAE